MKTDKRVITIFKIIFLFYYRNFQLLNIYIISLKLLHVNNLNYLY